MLAAGCSCVPDSGAPWLVVGVLLLGSVAVVAAGRRWRRRSSTRGSAARVPPVRAGGGIGLRAGLAAALLAGLAVVAAVVKPDADGSLLVLAAGVVVASAGVAPASWRRRDARTH